ncbi:MAG: hypothetical protein AAF560_29940 [Acidobacteriota bacterium]
MDWKATLDEILAERRQQLGDAPSTDELVALRTGDVTDDERQRLLELAAADPGVARELLGVLRFPQAVDDTDDKDDREGVGERWQAMRERMIAEGDLPAEDRVADDPIPANEDMEPARFGRVQAAAALALAVGAAFFGYSLRAPNVPTPQANPWIVELQAITDATAIRRGADERATLDDATGGVVLTLDVPEGLPEGVYRLIVLHDNESVATVDGLVPGRGGLLSATVPRDAWRDGLHELRLVVAEDVNAEGKVVARFRLEVERTP